MALVVPQSVVASPTDAIFNLAGLSGLPTITPILNAALPLTPFTLNSLYIAPLVAQTMTVTFTPYTGKRPHHDACSMLPHQAWRKRAVSFELVARAIHRCMQAFSPLRAAPWVAWAVCSAAPLAASSAA